jgi:GMC oxidoreductase
MGADPKTSAVNRYLQSWDVSNLFVLGASAFPQKAGYNPTLTVGALAFWAATRFAAPTLSSQGGSWMPSATRMKIVAVATMLIWPIDAQADPQNFTQIENGHYLTILSDLPKLSYSARRSALCRREGN